MAVSVIDLQDLVRLEGLERLLINIKSLHLKLLELGILNYRNQSIKGVLNFLIIGGDSAVNDVFSVRGNGRYEILMPEAFDIESGRSMALKLGKDI